MKTLSRLMLAGCLMAVSATAFAAPPAPVAARTAAPARRVYSYEPATATAPVVRQSYSYQPAPVYRATYRPAHTPSYMIQKTLRPGFVGNN